MTDKFTQEQYLDIVKKQKEHFPGNVLTLGKGNKKALDVYYDLSKKYDNGFYNIHLSKNKFLALLNPLTRELVYDDYVEEVKKYLWSFETKKDGTKSMNLPPYSSKIYFDNDNPTPLTETQIKNYFGDMYNLDVFDKEEVKQ